MNIYPSMNAYDERFSTKYFVDNGTTVNSWIEASTIITFNIFSVAQQTQKRLIPLRKTSVMQNAERANFNRLDLLYKQEMEAIKEVSPTREEKLLKLNIGGTSYLLLTDALIRTDRLSFLAKFYRLSHNARIAVADAYLAYSGEYYFQRSPYLFDAILHFYATGVIHRPAEMCAAAFLSELEFWRIAIANVGSCCAADIIPRKRAETKDEEKIDASTFDQLMCGNLRRKMWTFLEKPGSSTQAKAFQMLSTMFVAISVMGMSFGTIPDLQIVIQQPMTSASENETRLVNDEIPIRVEHPAFVFAERICIAFFTVEYILRYFAAPLKIRFVLKVLNVVDLLAIVPFYFELIFTLCGIDDKKLRDIRWAFLVVRILRVLRVIRIIKLGRFSSGLQTFGMTLQRSQKQLQMMSIVLLTGVIFFSTIIYFLEKDEIDTQFTSIPAAYWWCIVTMTTVGYGDAVPSSTAGKIVASAAIMCGVLVLALPISIMVDNFIKVAQDELHAEQAKQDLALEQVSPVGLTQTDDDD